MEGTWGAHDIGAGMPANDQSRHPVPESSLRGTPAPPSKPPADALLEVFDAPFPRPPSGPAWEADGTIPGRGRLAEVIVVLGGKGGVGKAERLSNRIPVPPSARYPSGWATIGTLEVGDCVYAPDGTATKVIGLSPITEQTVYELTLSDGQVIGVSGDHLWKVSSSWSRETYAPCHERRRLARLESCRQRAEGDSLSCSQRDR